MKKKLFIATAMFVLASCGSPAEQSTSREAYDVTFLNYDGTTLYVDHVEAGSDAEYKGETPKRPQDSYTVFSFDGWDGDLSNITKDTVLTAVFAESTETAVFKFLRSALGDSYLLKGFKEERTKEEITELYLPGEFNGLPVLAVGDWAFADCQSLETVSISEGLQYLSDYAFDNCDELRSVKLPSTLSRIDGRCFRGCDALKSIEVSSESKFLSSENGILYSRNGKKLLCYPTAGSDEIHVRGGVESIGPLAICGLTSGKRVSLPNSLIELEPDALIDNNAYAIQGYKPLFETFKRDGGLYVGSYENPFMVLVGVSDSASGNFTVVDGCRFVSDRVSYMNEDIVALTLPEGLVSVGASFNYCVNLQSVNLPSTLTTLFDFALAGCPNLSISGEFPESLIDLGRGSLTPSDAGFEGRDIPAFVTVSGNGCYVGPISNPYRFYLGPTSKNMPSYEVDAMTESIAGGGFSGCAAATSISMPDRVTKFIDGCFYGCSSLTQLRLPKRLEAIPDEVFRGCSALSELVVPESASAIGQWAFFDSSLEEIVYLGTKEEFLSTLKHPDWAYRSKVRKVVCVDGELAVFYETEEQ